MILGFGLLSTALAFDSEPQELTFVDDIDVFDRAEFTTGPLPSGSPLSVEFRIVSRGGLSTEMAAESQLSWPDALTQSIVGVPASGFIEFVTDLQLQAVVAVELDLGVATYSWNDVVWSQGLYLFDDADFEPLVLSGGSPTRVDLASDGQGIDPINYTIGIFTGVSLEFRLEAFPRASAALVGKRVDTWLADAPENVFSMITSDGTASIAVPEDNPGWVDLESSYVAQVSAALAIVFRPTLAVATPFGSFDVFTFEQPVDIVAYEQERVFEPVAYEHPLPSLEQPFESYDFGEVEVDDLVNLQVPLTSVGRMDVEGTLSIEGGDGQFTVYPEYFQAAPETTDGAVVTYWPTVEGDQTATLVIESNDPINPRIEIPLTGSSFVVEVPVDPEEEDEPDDRVTIERKCGCSTAPEASWAWLLGVGAMALGWRRRR